MHHPQQGADGKSPTAPCLTASIYPSVCKGVSNYDSLHMVMKTNRSTLGQCTPALCSQVMKRLYRGTQKISYYTFNTLKKLESLLYILHYLTCLLVFFYPYKCLLFVCNFCRLSAHFTAIHCSRFERLISIHKIL